MIRRAFSMIELLVVIGIIALLMAIVIPASAAVRRAAQLTQCQNNLRQIYTACASRAAENKGFVGLAGPVVPLPAASNLPEALNDSNRTRYRYYSAAPTYLQSIEHLLPIKFTLMPQLDRSARADTILEVSQLSRMRLNPALRVFECPAAPDEPADEPATDEIVVAGISYVESAYGVIRYAFNGGVFGFHFDQNTVPRRGRGVLPARGNVSSRVICGDMAITAAIAAWAPEVSGGGQKTTLQDVMDQTSAVMPGYARLDLARHRNRMNVVFADGHVAAVTAGEFGACVLAE